MLHKKGIAAAMLFLWTIIIYIGGTVRSPEPCRARFGIILYRGNYSLPRTP